MIQSSSTKPAIPRVLPGGQSAPVAADVAALAEAVARGTASMAAAESSFNRTAQTIVADVRGLRGEVSEVKGVVMRIEAAQQGLASKIGSYPLGPDLVRAMERESVREASPEAIAERDRRLEQARYGTGLIGDVKRADAKLAQKDADLEERLAAIASSHAKQAAEGVVEDAKDAARSGSKKTAVVGAGVAGTVAALAALAAALGGAEGIAAILRAFH